MRHRKKKVPPNDTGDRPEPKTTETPPEEKEETKDVPVKEVSKPKPTLLKKCAWIFFKIILFLVAFAVLAILFVIFALPRIVSEMQVCYLFIFVCYLKGPEGIMVSFAHR